MLEQLQPYLPLAALAVLGVAWASNNPKVKEYATKVYTWLMSFIPSKNKIPLINPDEVADLSEALELLSVHELLEELLVRAESDGDTDGLMLLGAYGKHVYDLRLEPKQVVKTSAKKKGV